MNQLLRFLLVTAVVTLALMPSSAQISLSQNPNLLAQPWLARWITHPEIDQQAFAVIHFRKTLDLAEVPERFVVHVSADNRYKLYVNGQQVSLGPARGDLRHWRFETVDLAPHLQPGSNVLAAVVWNFSHHKPEAQISAETAFIMYGDTEAEAVVNTDHSWKVWENAAYQPIPARSFDLRTYLVVGPGEAVDGRFYPWGWQGPDFDDASWMNAMAGWQGCPRGTCSGAARHLVPREIPPMHEEALGWGTLRRSEGIELPGDFSSRESLRIPANTTVRLLFDQGHLVTAYPQLHVSGGADASITLTYAEAMYRPENGGGYSKGNRNEIEGKTMRGIHDNFQLDGGDNRAYQTLWWRTYRYLEVYIRTNDEPLLLQDMHGVVSHYPFEATATIETGKPELADVWEVGWRTAQLCAHETYVDCPYYEQLQYVGDTRIQALISLYVSGDDRLMRRAIRDFEQSRIPDGLTVSRYPCHVEQIIPPYSLFWISMLHDYWMHRDDSTFVAQHLPGVEEVLRWYLSYVTPEGDLSYHPWWNFVDWSWPWNESTRFGGVPPGAGRGSHSSILTLQLVYTLDQAAELMEAFGEKRQASAYRQYLQQIRERGYATFWDRERGLFANEPSHETFSQHANIWAILTDAIPVYQQEELLTKVMEDESLTQATFYFRFYLHRALEKTGRGEAYFEQLAPWYEMLDLGLSTFAEKPDPTRSDCHAWSASPNYDLLALVAGIRPASAGFKTVLIEPQLGDLRELNASMPHPLGEIRVEYTRRGRGGLRAEVVLPEGLSGSFRFAGETKPLAPGVNTLAW